MNNKEHLALFLLGVGTLGITFLLLIALSDRETAGIPAVERHIEVPAVQAATGPQARIPGPPSMEAIESEIAETFAKTAAYLGRGTFEEKDHIALLERLEVYASISSIRPEHRKTAQGLIADMNRLLTLKESVARQVKLAGQISAAETDVQIHLAGGERDRAEARRLMDRIESLYAIPGLSETQNAQLRNSLAALKNSYTAAAEKAAPGETRQSGQAAKQEPPKPPAPVARAETAPEQPGSRTEEPRPAPKAPAVSKAEAGTADGPGPDDVIKRYHKVMTYVSRYFVAKKYDEQIHADLTSDLKDVAKYSSYLDPEDQKRLDHTIDRMRRIKELMMKRASLSKR